VKVKIEVKKQAYPCAFKWSLVQIESEKERKEKAL